jgi:hypothetical protein
LDQLAGRGDDLALNPLEPSRLLIRHQAPRPAFPG